MRIIFLSLLIFMSINVNATTSQLTALGQHNKSMILDSVSAKQKHKFPALYIYDTKQQRFLSKQDATAYLRTLSDNPLLPTLATQWLKSTEQFSTSNESLAKAIPRLKLDRAYLILYDNLPAPMLAQFKSMDPELQEKDHVLKDILSQLDNARSYITY
jgi:hypothetical protein